MFSLCLDDYISILLLSCFISNSALDSPDLLLSYPTTTLSSHMTFILIITANYPKFFYIFQHRCFRPFRKSRKYRSTYQACRYVYRGYREWIYLYISISLYRSYLIIAVISVSVEWCIGNPCLFLLYLAVALAYHIITILIFDIYPLSNIHKLRTYISIWQSWPGSASA